MSNSNRNQGADASRKRGNRIPEKQETGNTISSSPAPRLGQIVTQNMLEPNSFEMESNLRTEREGLLE